MTTYLVPNSFVCPPDIRIPIIDSGSTIKKLADAEQVDGTVIVLMTKEEIHFVAPNFRALGLEDVEILMNLPDVEYSSEWLLASQLMGRADAQSVFDDDRGERANQQREVQSVTAKLDSIDTEEKETQRLTPERESFRLGRRLLNKEDRKETFDETSAFEW